MSVQTQTSNKDLQVTFFWTLLARHLCTCFDINPDLLPPPPLPPLPPDFAATHQIALSASQKAQITDVFDLFDTDGGGTIDQKELNYALVALGFQSKVAKAAKAIISDPTITHLLEGNGSVTLEEFSALMRGEIGGADPRDTLWAIFATLSREGPEAEGRAGARGLITVPKLEAVCRDFKVRRTSQFRVGHSRVTIAGTVQ